jgi:tetratricopeptide (TPR) repeat protein
LAGVLAALGRNKDAFRMYEGLSLVREDRSRLAALYAADKNFAAAEQQYRIILKETPDDRTALRQLADVLSWRKQYPESLALFRRLAHDAPQDREVQRRLAEVLLWSGAAGDARTVFEKLLQGDPGNAELQVRVAEAALGNRDYDGALARFQALLETKFDQPELWRSFVDAAAIARQVGPEQARLAVRIAEQGEPNDGVFLARLAWVLQRVKETEWSGKVLDRAVALRPQQPAERKELAGMLAAAGKTKAALQMYDGLPLELDDRYQLASLYAADQDFAAAEQQCRLILKEKPEDRKALRLLAGVLTWKKDYPQALALMTKLAEADKTDTELPLRLAELMLWSGDYDKALERFQGLLEANFDQPALWHSFVDAAASAREVTDAQRALALRIGERTIAAESRDAAFLARVGWLLYRAGESTKATVLLDQAVALHPQEPGVRRELAGTLAAVGKSRDALGMFEGLTLDEEDRYHLVGVYATALQKCRDVLEEQPDDKDARDQSAYILGWKKMVQESVALLQERAGDSPSDRPQQIRAAQVTLWSGAYADALKRLQAVLEEQFEQPELWRDTIDAAASTEAAFTPAQARLLERIYDRRAATETKVEYLSRLAWVLHLLKEAPKVERLLDRALALHPKDPAVCRELAGVLASAGRYDEARRLYDGLKLTFADHYRLAEISIAGRHYEEAEKEVSAILKARPDDFRGRMLQAAILSGSKQYAEASRLYRKLMEEHPDDRTLPVKVAELTLWGGDYDGALVLFQEVLDRDAEQPDLWKGYVDAAASAKQLPDKARPTAVQIYERIRQAKSEDPVFLGRLAWVLRRVKETDRSVVLLEQAVALEPTSRPLRQQLAEALQEKGDYDEAEKHYRILLRTRPKP